MTDYEFENGNLKFAIKNFGFASPLNFNYLAVAVKDKNGEISEIEVKNYDKKQLLSGESVMYSLTIPKNFEIVGVKMDTQKGAGVNPRFANDTVFSDGIQYFK